MKRSMFVLICIFLLLPAVTLAEQKYSIISSGQLGKLKDKGGSLLASGTPMQVDIGSSRKIAGIKIESFSKESILGLTSIDKGDVIFAINRKSFEAVDDLQSYIQSMEIPGEISISYIDVSNNNSGVDVDIRDRMMTRGELSALLEKQRNVDSGIQRMYRCGHISDQEYDEYHFRENRTRQDNSGIVSVIKQLNVKLYAIEDRDWTIGLLDKVDERAKTNICVIRDPTSREISEAVAKAEQLWLCSELARYNLALGRANNEDLQVRRGADAFNEIRSVGMNAREWMEQQSRDKKYINDVIGNYEKISKDCSKFN